MSMEGYLRMLQRGYFFAYGTGLLRRSREYVCHYFVKKLVRRGDTIIDIGANLGYYSILFSRWTGKAGRVYSVEPIELYNRVFMKKARRRRNITLLPYALGTEDKEVTLVSSPNVGYLRSGLPHVYDEHRDGDIKAQEFTFKAHMKRPSELFGNLERIDYIKCDIEGFEYTVLSEMKDIIARTKPVLQVELWPDNEKPLMDMVQSLGYKPFKPNGGKLTANAASISGDWIFIPDTRMAEFTSIIL